MGAQSEKMSDGKSWYESVYDQDSPTDSPHGWIQWKGTDVCMDTHCKCGWHGHIDAEFAYFYECPNCHTIYAVGAVVRLIELTHGQIDNRGGRDAISPVSDGDDGPR